jgi:membrane protein
VDLLRPVRAFDSFQQRHRVLAFPVAVVKKFSDDQAGNLAALVAYYAFFSLFPLLLVFVTVLGFVLQGDPSARTAIEKSALSQFPIIGSQNFHALKGSTSALVVGIVGALWAGLGVTRAAQQAFDRIWAVPYKHRPNFIMTRLRGLMLLFVLGVLTIISTVVSGFPSAGGLHGVPLTIAAFVLSILMNLVLFWAAFRLLTSASVATRCLLVGAVLAAIFWEILQVAGGLYVGHVLRHASVAYGTFGLVIGLLSWLYLGAQLTLYAAEVNVVRARRLWPRSLLEPVTPADKETLKALAEVEERTDTEEIDVRFRRPKNA